MALTGFEPATISFRKRVLYPLSYRAIRGVMQPNATVSHIYVTNVCREGIEPPTPRVRAWCSALLS